MDYATTQPYSEDKLLMLSGIQHIAFCERQYALAYIEMQWTENHLTAEGRLMHTKTDDPFKSESRNNIAIIRSLPITSYRLGLNGIADIVEFIKPANDKNGIEIKGRPGLWLPCPVEYKRGKPKADLCDEVQLCAQAYALEEAYNIAIDKGYIYYGEIRHRHEVVFTNELREQTITFARRMHELFETGTTPKPIWFSGCKSCSLHDICMPRMDTCSESVNDYIRKNIEP